MYRELNLRESAIESYKQTIERAEMYRLPTEHGEFDVYCYRDNIRDGNQTHIALVKGEIRIRHLLRRTHSR